MPPFSSSLPSSCFGVVDEVIVEDASVVEDDVVRTEEDPVEDVAGGEVDVDVLTVVAHAAPVDNNMMVVETTTTSRRFMDPPRGRRREQLRRRARPINQQ